MFLFFSWSLEIERIPKRKGPLLKLFPREFRSEFDHELFANVCAAVNLEQCGIKLRQFLNRTGEIDRNQMYMLN